MVMSEPHSVTNWIQQLKAGEGSDAQQQLWNRYFRRLVRLADKQLGDTPRRVADQEDVALNALSSFFEGVGEGAFPQLKDRTSLWPLLAKITVRKAINQREWILAQKRGGGKVRGDSAFANPNLSSDQVGIGQIPSDDPTPEFLLELNEQCRHLLDVLNDDTLRLVARRKLQKCTNSEIASELGIVQRNVERKLELIRAIWSSEAPG